MSLSTVNLHFPFLSCLPRIAARPSAGFTLVELLVVVAIIAILSAVAIPTFNSYRDGCCLKAAMADLCTMIRETKYSAANEKYFAVGFKPEAGRVALISGKGPDGSWNTADDLIVRSFLLSDKGGGLSFGYGSYGPLPDLAETADGITFQSNNTLVCNEDMTGNAGTVYIISKSGSAMALTMNSKDFGYKLYRWTGSNWQKL